MIQYDQWHGKYKDGWKGHITSSSFSHPAKFSKGLIFHIIQHVIDEGWVIPGKSTCVDPFAGIGGGALPCALQGIQWLGCELESRFVALANGAECGGDIAKHEACSDTGEHGPHHLLGNLELWQRKYGVLPQWKQPVLLQGDSRNLCAIIQAHADLLVSSSPYADTRDPAYVRQNTVRDKTHLPVDATKTSEGQGYGTSPGQLGALPPGSLDAALAPGDTEPPPQVDLLVSSSPYVESLRGNDTQDYTPEKITAAKISGTTAIKSDWGVHKPSGNTLSGKGYGTSLDNLGNLPPGSVDAALAPGADLVAASPPYADGCTHTGGADPQPQHVQGGPLRYVQYGAELVVSSSPFLYTDGGTASAKDPRGAIDAGVQARSAATRRKGYGESEAQLGNMPPGDVAAAVQGDLVAASPPWMEESNAKKPSASRDKLVQGANPGSMDAVYGATPGQLGATGDLSCNPTCDTCGGRARGASKCACEEPQWKFRGEKPGTTFWSAAKTIISETYKILRPGAHAVWVTKHYIRDGALVDFPGQWKTLCEHVGFQTVHIHLAMLVERRVETHLFEGEHTYEQWTESFFRRLSRRKTGIGVEFETVICQVKPFTTAPLPPDEAWEQLPLVDCTVTSPAYADSWHAAESTEKNEDRMRKAGYSDEYIRQQARPSHGPGSNLNAKAYGTSEGQLGAMRVGSLGATLSVSSPSYGGNEKSDYLLSTDGKTRQRDEKRGYVQGHGSFRGSETYGQTEGQLGAMRAGSVDGVITSPPFVDSLTPGNRTSTHDHRQALANDAGHGRLGGGQLTHGTRYSWNPLNLGNLPEGTAP